MTNPYGDQPVPQKAANPYGDQPQTDLPPLGDAPAKPGALEILKSIDLGKSASAAPQSAAGIAEAALMPIYRPVETAQAAGYAGEALFERFISNQVDMMSKLAGGDAELPTPKWDNLTSHYRETYGSAEGFKKAVETDPFGVIADGLAMLFGATGAARLMKKTVANTFPEDMPNKMVEEIVKFPSRNLKDAEVKEMVEFMLRENIPVTSAGVRRLDEIINTTGRRIEELLQRADNGQTIPAAELNNVLAEMKQKTYGKTPLSGKDRKVIDSVIDGWSDEIAASGKTDFNLHDLQDFKKSTYGKVYWADTDSNKKNVRNAALKAQALEAKKRLEVEVPGIKEANQRQGTALELKPLLDNSVKRIDRNKGNMSTFLGTGTGSLIGGATDAALYAAGMPIPPGTFTSIGTGVGALKSFAGQPGMKRRLAQSLYDAQRLDPALITDPLIKAMSIAAARENQEKYDAGPR